MKNLQEQYPPIASEDFTGQNNFSDVIGNKNDNSLSTPGNDSLYGLAGFMGYYHVHSPAQLYPILADPITVTASANAWTDYGSWVEIVPASTITDAFDVHWIDIYDISANGNYVLQLGSGASGSEIAIATIGFGRNAVQSQEGNVPVQIAPQPANTRISARLSSSNAAANTADIKVYYHIYPS